MTLAIAVDLLLAALLVATLAYGAMLNRRLGRLRQDRDRLAEVVGQFNEATARAVAGMEGIKATADASGTSLQSVIDRAGATIEDLRFLVERGERAAARLEARTRSEALRASAPPGIAPVAAAPLAPAPRAEPDVTADRRGLRELLQGMR